MYKKVGEKIHISLLWKFLRIVSCVGSFLLACEVESIYYQKMVFFSFVYIDKLCILNKKFKTLQKGMEKYKQHKL